MMDCNSLMRNYSRYLLLVFNLVFALTGIIIISAGLSAKAYFYEFDALLDNRYNYVSDLLIIVGIIIFFIAFFGCCGALKENACMTTTFSTLLIVIFIMELLVGIAGVLLKNKTESFLEDALRTSMRQYDNNNTEMTALWDEVQQRFQCCGVVNYTDWTNYSTTNHTIPMSCCHIPAGTTNIFTCAASNPENIYKEGCLVKFGDYIREHISTVEGVGIGLAIIQFLGIILSCYLSKQIRSDYETV